METWKNITTHYKGTYAELVDLYKRLQADGTVGDLRIKIDILGGMEPEIVTTMSQEYADELRRGGRNESMEP